MKRLLVITLFAVGISLGGLPAAMASPTATHSSCRINVDTKHTAVWSEADIEQSCGHYIRGYGKFGKVFKYGPWKKEYYSKACDDYDCDGHPDGKLTTGGWQGAWNMVKHCGFGCTAATVVAGRIQNNSCVGTSECLFYKGQLGGPGWFESEWITNVHFHFERGVAKCGNGTRYTILNKGGWVTALDTFSRANCTKSYPNLVGAAFDIKTCSTCSFTRHWVSTINLAPIRTTAFVRHSSCSYGAIGTSWNPGPPGKAHVWLGTPDVPTACGMVRAEAWAQNGPHPVFGKWNKNVGFVSTATIPSTWPNPRLLRASEWKEHIDGTNCMKRRFYPTVGSWVPC